MWVPLKGDHVPNRVRIFGTEGIPEEIRIDAGFDGVKVTVDMLILDKESTERWGCLAAVVGEPRAVFSGLSVDHIEVWQEEKEEKQ